MRVTFFWESFFPRNLTIIFSDQSCPLMGGAINLIEICVCLSPFCGRAKSEGRDMIFVKAITTQGRVIQMVIGAPLQKAASHGQHARVNDCVPVSDSLTRRRKTLIIVSGKTKAGSISGNPVQLCKPLLRALIEDKFRTRVSKHSIDIILALIGRNTVVSP